VVVTKFAMTYSYFSPCCFSPDGRLVAVATAQNVHVWDITGSDPHLVETFVGHTNNITSLAFSSLSILVSASEDRSVRFWQIGTSSADPVVTGPKSTPLALTPIKSITPKVETGTIIPSDLGRVTKTWGILTSPCKGSLQIPAEDSHQSNIQPIGNKLIFAWYTDREINIWDAERGELLQKINVPGGRVKALRVSGDGCKVFCLYVRSIQAWDICTGEAVGKVQLWHNVREILATDGSKVWVSSGQGWDFGIPGSSPVQLVSGPPSRLHLNDTRLWETNMSRMRDVVTGKIVFQLPHRFGKPVYVQWGGQCLLACFRLGEVLVLDFSHTFLW